MKRISECFVDCWDCLDSPFVCSHISPDDTPGSKLCETCAFYQLVHSKRVCFHRSENFARSAGYCPHWEESLICPAPSEIWDFNLPSTTLLDWQFEFQVTFKRVKSHIVEIHWREPSLGNGYFEVAWDGIYSKWYVKAYILLLRYALDKSELWNRQVLGQ